jgi:hypothetical protein
MIEHAMRQTLTAGITNRIAYEFFISIYSPNIKDYFRFQSPCSVDQLKKRNPIFQNVVIKCPKSKYLIFGFPKNTQNSPMSPIKSALKHIVKNIAKISLKNPMISGLEIFLVSPKKPKKP